MQNSKTSRVLKRWLACLFPLLIIGVGIAAFVYLVTHRPTAPRAVAEEVVTTVETLSVAPTAERVIVDAMGVVIPSRQVDLRAQVGGKITRQHPGLIEGGRFPEGALLLQIEPDDYLFDITQRQANVAKAMLDLRLEKGRQAVAQREWSLFESDIATNGAARDVALRIPHLLAAEAALNGARSALALSRLHLERTRIRAPFNAVVLSESTDVGQVVSPGSPLAVLADTDACHVRVSVPIQALKWLELPGPDGRAGPRAIVKLDTGEGDPIARPGRVIRLLGDLEPSGRMARLLVEVKTPFDPPPGASEDTAPLLLGAYVSVAIEGRPLTNVYVLPRSAVREGDRVWIMNDENRLDIRDISIAWGRKDNVLVRHGLEEGDRVVTSRLAMAVPGMRLRDVGDLAPAGGSAPDTQATAQSEMPDEEGARPSP